MTRGGEELADEQGAGPQARTATALFEAEPIDRPGEQGGQQHPRAEPGDHRADGDDGGGHRLHDQRPADLVRRPRPDALALVVAWGANHNWGAVQRRRLEREGERPVPHYWEHVLWVWGHTEIGPQDRTLTVWGQ